MTPQQEFARFIVLIVCIALFAAFISGYLLGK